MVTKLIIHRSNQNKGPPNVTFDCCYAIRISIILSLLLSDLIGQMQNLLHSFRQLNIETKKKQRSQKQMLKAESFFISLVRLQISPFW